MPELPDVAIYIEALRARVLDAVMRRVHLRNPFLVRTADPPIESLEGSAVRDVRRMGKRIVLGFEQSRWLVIHLMIAGRLHWKQTEAVSRQKTVLCSFQFDSGQLSLTEAGSHRRASIHLVQGDHALAALDPGGLEVLEASLSEFVAALKRRNRTLKRALTDPRLFSGIGNSYSDEILHAARLSPTKLTGGLGAEDAERLFLATQQTLRVWIERLREDCGSKFPERVTAFRKGMAVHGRFGQACPVCQAQIQRIRYANNETNYCPQCQTGGRLLSDRSLARLLKDDWPGSIQSPPTEEEDSGGPSS